MLIIDNIKNIEGNMISIKGASWKIVGVTEMDNGKPQYQFYLNHETHFRTIYLDRIIDTPKNSCNIINKDYYKLHTSQNARYVSTEELRNIGSTMYWMEQVCE
jgi:hypothetical protein